MWRSCKWTTSVSFHDNYIYIIDSTLSWQNLKPIGPGILNCVWVFWVPGVYTSTYRHDHIRTMMHNGIADPGFSLRTWDARPLAHWNTDLSRPHPVYSGPILVFRSNWSKMPLSQIIQIGEWSPNITYYHIVTLGCPFSLSCHNLSPCFGWSCREIHDKRSPPTAYQKAATKRKRLTESWFMLKGLKSQL